MVVYLHIMYIIIYILCTVYRSMVISVRSTDVMIITYVLACVYVLIVVVCIKLIDCIFAYVMQKNKITLLAINILLVFFFCTDNPVGISNNIIYITCNTTSKIRI